MRIMFKRPAQFPLRDGTLSKVYAQDVEHDIPDAIMSQIAESLLYKQLRGSGNAVPIKDTAPPAKAGKKSESEKNKANEAVDENHGEGNTEENGEGGESTEGGEKSPEPSAAKAGKKSEKKTKG